MAKKIFAAKARQGAARSQAAKPPAVESSHSNSKPAPAPAKPAPSARIEDRVRELYRHLAGGAADPHSKESDLQIALARFLADDKLNRVISQLEEIARECPGTVEGTKADAAIQALKAGAACASSSHASEKPAVDDD